MKLLELLPDLNSKSMLLLSLFGNFASVLSLGVSLAVLIQTRAIRKSFLVRSRLPAMVVAIKQINAALLNAINDPDECHRQLHRLNAVLKNLLPKVAGTERDATKKLLKQLGVSRWGLLPNANMPRLSRDEAMNVYSGTEGLIEALKQLEKDSKWS